MTEDVTLPRPVLVVARTLSVVAGILLVGLILLTIADVVSRNFRDRSIVGTVEIATMLLVAIAFLGLASAEADGERGCLFAAVKGEGACLPRCCGGPAKAVP